MNVAEAFDAYLRSGESDPTCAARSGSIYERGEVTPVFGS